ncbi:COX15/CtaA family protein [Zavarzinia compransoris]|uniref:Heme A synthase n=1 Tax=Zavarzinia compransoris TaxID=1264899 RepID=A0A317E9E8_9PROT|nr:COX15/CtaA family protein [Zavarzinia compransoris]PWR23728.1 heme A synthase [Zavarzinia compransoris]TDP47953.1 cytochrome c oxidase assembly protein subunit 15 [Zavarzinia compransoris]
MSAMSMSQQQSQAGAPAAPAPADRAVARWLFVVSFLLLVMVVLGGVTRLTDSGLSITEWKPVTGALPPLSDEAWAAEFEKYKQIPQYELVNKGMSLDAFKQIFWYEWAHRLLGRLIGFAFLVPYLWFLLRGKLDRPMAWRLAGILVLGGLQGAMGWFMVASGLSERISVSQYRLAAHLSLAFVIHAAVFWTALDLTRGRVLRVPSPGLSRLAGLAVLLLFVQIVLGAFVAGLDAGMAYNTWPLMDGDWVPNGLFTHVPAWIDPFENNITAQFLHRHFAIVVAAVILGHAVLVRQRAPQAAGAAGLAAFMVVLQFILGVWTLLAVVPVDLGALHQAGAFVLFTLGLNLWHRLRRA